MAPPRVTGSATRIGPAIPSLHRVTAILFASVVGVCGSGHAEEFDDDSLRDIVDGKVWATEDGWGVWTWQADNELCVRTFPGDEDCTDSGPWAIDDGAICYELEWWSDSYGLRKNCFVVRAVEDGRYEAIPRGSAVDSAVFAFSLAE